MTAAQVLRLVEEGAIGLEDSAADHLPPELDGYDANGATIRELLGMRSGIDDPANAGAILPERSSCPLSAHASSVRCHRGPIRETTRGGSASPGLRRAIVRLCGA